MDTKHNVVLFWLAGAILLTAGCTGVNTFTTAARPGETIAVAAGWNQKLTRSTLTVTITPQTGPVITYAPGDYRIRSIVQAYPDPVSKLVISDRARVTYPGAGNPQYSEEPNPIIYNQLSPATGNNVRYNTGQENDWSQTIVYLDIPSSIAPGGATLQFSMAGVNLLPDGTVVEVLPVAAGISKRNFFDMSDYAGLGAMIRAGERAPHFAVRFSGPEGVIPHSIQADFTRTLSGTGNAWVTHPRGDIQNAMWTDTGSLIKVMLSPAKGATTDRLSDFKFYVTGAVTGLTTNTVKAYDIAGNPLSGFTASIEFVNN